MYLYTKVLLISFFVFSPIILSAQDPDTPCGDFDPGDNTCPVDDWVFIFAVPMVAIGAIRLHKISKALIV